MKTIFNCSTCGVVSEDQNQLCRPEMMESAEICSVDPKQTENICAEVDQGESYTCSSCGRPALEPERLCDPVRRG